MGAPLNNVTAPDQYDPAATLYCPGTVELRIFVHNQPILYRRGVTGYGGQGIQWRDEEEFLAPGVWPVPDLCDAVSIRAAIPLAGLKEGRRQAQVTIHTRTRAELT